MSTAPRTHHQIIELGEPFLRQGLHIDLAASDRLQRRLRFRSIEHAGPPALRETLQLDGSAALQGLSLQITVPSTSGVSASLVLESAAAKTLDLPQDLLAVLGRNCAPLQRAGSIWKSRVRTAAAELALDRAAMHLADTLAAPPGRLHDQHRRARSGVVLRRLLPTLTALSLLATVALLPRPGLGPDRRCLDAAVPRAHLAAGGRLHAAGDAAFRDPVVAATVFGGRVACLAAGNAPRRWRIAYAGLKPGSRQIETECLAVGVGLQRRGVLHGGGPSDSRRLDAVRQRPAGNTC